MMTDSDPSDAGRIRTGARWLLWGVTLFLFLAGTALCLLMVVEFDVVRGLVEESFTPRRARYFTPDLYRGIQLRFLPVGVALIAVSGGLLFFQCRLRAAFERYLTDLSRSARQLAHATAQRFTDLDRFELAALLIVIVVGIVVRASFLTQPVREDEAGTFILFASKPLFVGMSLYPSPNNHIFQSVLVHFSTAILGSAPWVIRLPVFLTGVLTIPLSFIVLGSVFGRRAGLFGAAVVAGSHSMILFSTNARGIILVCFFFLAAVGLLRYARNHGGSAAWLAFVVSLALGFYSVPTMLYGYAVLAVWAVLFLPFQQERTERTRFMKAFTVYSVLAGCITVALYAPVLFVMGPSALLANDVVAGKSLSAVATQLPAFLALIFEQWTTAMPLPVLVLLGTGLVACLVFRRRISTDAMLLAPAIVLGLGTVILLHQTTPHPRGRVWLFLLPLVAGWSGAGIGVFTEIVTARMKVKADHVVSLLAVATAAVLAGGAMWTQSVYLSEESGTARDAVPTVEFLRERIQPHDRVLTGRRYPAAYEYAFTRAGIPLHHLARGGNVQLDSATTLYLAFEPRKTAPDDVLRSFRLNPDTFEEPALLTRFSYGVVYTTRHRH